MPTARLTRGPSTRSTLPPTSLACSKGALSAMVQPTSKAVSTTEWSIDIYRHFVDNGDGERWHWGYRCPAHGEPIGAFGYITLEALSSDLLHHLRRCTGGRQ